MLALHDIPGAAMNAVGVPLGLLRNPAGFGGIPRGDCLTGRPVLREGRLVGLQPAPGRPVGHILLPQLTEVHCHLDKCHTIDRIDAPPGDLGAAIAAQARDKRRWTADDIRARAGRALAEYRAAGTGVIRSHVDWGTPDDPYATPLAWPLLAELAQDHPGLQLSALVDIDLLAEPGVAARVARVVAGAGGVLGGFVLHHARRRDGLRAIFEAAGRQGLALDFHVDEGLDAGLDGLRLIVETATETRFDGPILCGHACSLANLPPDDLARLAEGLARSGIALAVLPATNLYLQGRQGRRSPDRRGIAPLHDLRALGVQVVVGTDNVGDAFHPGGRHDPLWALQIAALGCQLDPPMGDWLALITTEAQAALGLPPVALDGAPIAGVMAWPAATTADLFGRTGAPLRLADLDPETRP